MANWDESVVDLLVSRICHDLISPVGAAVNGMELHEEHASSQHGVGDEALALVASSVRQASARLSFFRVVFGAAGARGDQSIAEARKLAEGYLADGKAALAWAAVPALESTRPGPGGVRLLLGSVLLASQSLPRGGEMQIMLVAERGGSRLRGVVAASGPGARLDEAAAAVLAGEGPAGGLDTRTIAAHAIRASAERFGITLGVQPAPDSVTFTVTLPPPAD